MLKIELKKMFIDYLNLFSCNEITAKLVKPILVARLLKPNLIYKPWLSQTLSRFFVVKKTHGV